MKIIEEFVRCVKNLLAVETRDRRLEVTTIIEHCSDAFARVSI